ILNLTWKFSRTQCRVRNKISASVVLRSVRCGLCLQFLGHEEHKEYTKNTMSSTQQIFVSFVLHSVRCGLSCDHFKFGYSSNLFRVTKTQRTHEEHNVDCATKSSVVLHSARCGLKNLG